jgi:addiction module HigA family antidote
MSAIYYGKGEIMANALQSPGSFLSLMLEKYRLNPFKLAQDIHLSQSAVRLITLGKIKITTSVAMRLAKYFNTNPEFWLAMQMKWDVAEAAKDKTLMKIVKSISRVTKGAADGGGKTATVKKSAAKKKTAKKTAAQKKAVKAKKSVTGKKVKAAKKPVTRKRITAAKKPVAQKKTVKTRKPVTGRKITATKKPATGKRAAVKKPVVKTGRKPAAVRAKSAGRRGRPPKK